MKMGEKVRAKERFIQKLKSEGLGPYFLMYFR